MPKTFSFYLRVGEMTITVQDVAVLLEFLINGPIVTMRHDRDWMTECARLLSRQPPQTIRGGAVKLQ